MFFLLFFCVNHVEIRPDKKKTDRQLEWKRKEKAWAIVGQERAQKKSTQSFPMESDIHTFWDCCKSHSS
jgi:hypothetical protein